MSRRLEHVTTLRVRYSETDQMGTYYNSRPLEWFECGRTEMLRALGKPYSRIEQDGLLLPVREAHVEYLGKARYDDLLKITSRMSMSGRAKVRFDVTIEHAETGEAVCCGWTVHAFLNPTGRPTRPPDWLVEMIQTRELPR